MNTLKTPVDSEFEIKGSRFLAFLIPFEEFESTFLRLREAHRKAVHFVYAYRFYDDGKINERFSDDGEPKGSSGMPVLNVLRGQDLVDIALIVVRYFGGTLLGVGGLVRAYSEAALLCVKKLKENNLSLPFEISKSLDLEIPYVLLGKIEYLSKKLLISLQKDDFLPNCVRVKLVGSVEALEKFEKAYNEDLKFRS